MANVIENSWKSATIQITGNETVRIVGQYSSLASDNQFVLGASVKKVWFSSDGTWMIFRGSDLVHCASGSGHHYFDGGAININPNANMTFSLFRQPAMNQQHTMVADPTRNLHLFFSFNSQREWNRHPEHHKKS